MTPKSLSFYHDTYFFGRKQLNNYSFRSNGTKISSNFVDQQSFSKSFDKGDIITMSLNIKSCLNGTLSFCINDGPKEEAFNFYLGSSKYKMAVSLWKGSSIQLLKYKEYGSCYNLLDKENEQFDCDRD